MDSDRTSTCCRKMEEEDLGVQRRPLIVLVPFPAQGHVTPMLHLAAAFRRHGFRPVVVLPESIHRRLSSSEQRRPDMGSEAGREVVLAPVPDGLADGTRGAFFALERAMEEVMPVYFEDLLRSLDGVSSSGGGRLGRVGCVVVDLLASWAMVVADRCMVPVAGFWPAMLATHRLISAAPDMIRRGLISDTGIPTCEATISDELPCCMPRLSTGDLPWLVGDVESQRGRFAFWQRTLQRSSSLRWLLVNTFPGEGCRHRFGSMASPVGPRVYQVGPLAAAAGDGGWSSTGSRLSLWEEDGSCVQWLDAQPPGSVVYVSFGSWVGPIGEGSVLELAVGLEATRRPFLWVVGDSWRAGLPEGYLDRVAGRGKVVQWAPQREVLRHGAVGCYLTHCGWNSTMEAAQCKKRLLCFPVAGDQFINCRYIVEAWGIGVRLKSMRRAAVQEGVERVMGAEGDELQRKVNDMSEELNGEEGCGRAAAELLAFEVEVKNGRVVGGEWLKGGDGAAGVCGGAAARWPESGTCRLRLSTSPLQKEYTQH